MTLSAAAASSSSQPASPLFFGNPTEALESARTLRRLQLLNACFPSLPRMRARQLEALSQCWASALMIPSEEMRTYINTSLHALGPKIEAIYTPIIASAETPKLPEIVRNFLADTQSLHDKPVTKSKRGVHGPTLLARSRLHTYVIKWIRQPENECNRLYSIFSQYIAHFENSDHFGGFLAPQSTSFDFTRLSHQRSDGTEALLSKDDLEMKTLFEEVARQEGAEKFHGGQIMLSERICGSNLIDFAQTEYKEFTPDQKQKLFQRLGRLAVIDLLFGHFDRLFHILPGSNGYEFLACEANLGNAMVAQSLLYAIDNEIEIKLIDDPKCRQGYIQFLQKTLARPDFSKLMAEHMVQCTTSALDNEGDNRRNDNVIELKAKLKPFRDDLHAMGRVAFESGIDEMRSFIKETLIPAWGTPATESIRKQLSAIHPDLPDAVWERLQHFKQ